MANTTIYPYGTGGTLPASIGVINDLVTGGADKALSAEQGKVLNGMINPAVDASFTQFGYDGTRLKVGAEQTGGVKVLTTMRASMQGMAAYGNLIVRLANGSTHYVYSIAANGGLTQLASFSLNVGHGNSAQFAPVLYAGQDFPYLYVATLSKQCKVLSISSAYAVSIVQTITIDGSLVAAGLDDNTQIGDDGYMWTMYQEADGRYTFLKFRKVAVAEGDVTLTSADVLDRWTTDEVYPYSSYVWQGMKIKEGKIWLVYGETGSGQERGITIYDTATHAHSATLDMSAAINEELEDCDMWNGCLLLATYSANVCKVVL